MPRVYGFTAEKKTRWSGLLPAGARTQAIGILRSTGATVHLVTLALSEVEQEAWKAAAATGPISHERAREILSRARGY